MNPVIMIKAGPAEDGYRDVTITEENKDLLRNLVRNHLPADELEDDLDTFIDTTVLDHAQYEGNDEFEFELGGVTVNFAVEVSE